MLITYMARVRFLINKECVSNNAYYLFKVSGWAEFAKYINYFFTIKRKSIFRSGCLCQATPQRDHKDIISTLYIAS